MLGKLQIGLPVTSRANLVSFDSERLFSIFAATFAKTASYEMEYNIYLGIDDNDEYYNKNLDTVVERLTQITKVKITPIILHGLSGKILPIWETLALEGYKDGADFFLFAGDDMKIFTKNWDINLCTPIAKRGYGIEAFYDISFAGFPTFPIFYKSHFECFNRLFPESFSNASQYGDPFIYKLYESFNAAHIQKETRCKNMIGGKRKCRYEKVNPILIPWKEWKEKLSIFLKTSFEKNLIK